MTSNSEQWWYCLKHNRVEDGNTSCAGKDLLGPYSTREEAARALDRVQERNKEWDEQD